MSSGVSNAVTSGICPVGYVQWGVQWGAHWGDQWGVQWGDQWGMSSDVTSGVCPVRCPVGWAVGASSGVCPVRCPVGCPVWYVQWGVQCDMFSGVSSEVSSGVCCPCAQHGGLRHFHFSFVGFVLVALFSSARRLWLLVQSWCNLIRHICMKALRVNKKGFNLL